jgi:hypothetical protein
MVRTQELAATAQVIYMSSGQLIMSLKYRGRDQSYHTAIADHASALYV